MSATTKKRSRTKTDLSFADRAFEKALEYRWLRLDFIGMFAEGKIEMHDYLRMSEMFNAQ